MCTTAACADGAGCSSGPAAGNRAAPGAMCTAPDAALPYVAGQQAGPASDAASSRARRGAGGATGCSVRAREGYGVGSGAGCNTAAPGKACSANNGTACDTRGLAAGDGSGGSAAACSAPAHSGGCTAASAAACGAGGAGAPCGAGGGSDTAFRRAEKQFQLHKDQQLSYKKGRLRGGKMVLRPTDLSAVLDFVQLLGLAALPLPQPPLQAACDGVCVPSAAQPSLAAASWAAGSGQCCPAEIAKSRHDYCCCTDGDCSAAADASACPSGAAALAARWGVRRLSHAELATPVFTLAAHPGFYYLPGALSAELQWQLAADALGTWPDPPARTSHSAGLGPLPGLWEAARAGLALAAPAAVERDQGAQRGRAATFACSGGATAGCRIVCSATHSGHSCGAAAARHGAQCSCRATAAQLCSVHVAATAADCSGKAAPPGQAQHTAATTAIDSSGLGGPDAHAAATDAQTAQQAACSLAQAGWSGGLWVAGGDGPPAGRLLQRLRWVALGPPFNWTTRRYEPDAPSRPLPVYLRRLAVRLAGVARAAAAEADGAAGMRAGAGTGVLQAAMPQGPRLRFNPSAALVNYYREGDTLGGHCDDAERDMSAPIVSLSLGCDAIFLMGGETKAEAPVPIRLRSGDAIILSGRARRSYHGVPRILSGGAPPAAFSGAGVPGWAVPVGEYLSQARINISIRDIT